MAPNKQWMQLADDDRLNETYLSGVQKFLDYAFQYTGEKYEVRCPCIRCCNTTLGTRKTIQTHLIVHGIIKNYTFWYHHGEHLSEPVSESEDEDENGDGDEVEECESKDEVEELLRDLYPNLDGGNTHTDCDDLLEEEPNVEAKIFYSLLNDLEQPLYQNSKASKLSSLIKLLHIKSTGRWSNASFTTLLKMLKEELLPDGSNLPNSYYEAKKIIRDLGLSYNKIDACTNDCMLYWKEDSSLDSCKVCGASRWKIDTHNGETRKKKARSSRNAENRSKLKMSHHIGSKPIRDLIYEKDGKDGNPPDLATIFFETHKKNNRLVEAKAIEKHAEIKEMIQSDPSLPSIEIVEKYCGAQNCSHVFGFGGGLRAKDLKGGTSSKGELLFELRPIQKENKSLNEENKSLHDRLFALEDKMKDIDKIREFSAAQQSHVPPTTSPVSTE